MTKCLICGHDCRDFKTGPTGDIFEITCETCGHFCISEDAKEKLEQLEATQPTRYKVQSFIRHHNLVHERTFPYVFFGNTGASESYPASFRVDEIISRFPQPLSELLNQILLNLYRKQPKPGEEINIKTPESLPNDCPLLCAQDYKVAAFYLEALRQPGLITAAMGSGNVWKIFLTPEGFNRIYDIETQHTDDSPIVFVALDFAPKFKPIYHEGIKPVLLHFGFQTLCLLEEEHNNQIEDEIIAGIRKSRFIIADFTDQNQGVYWEAGFAAGLGKIVIPTCRETEIGSLHFDTSHRSHVLWKDYNDLQDKLAKRIEATIFPLPPKP